MESSRKHPATTSVMQHGAQLGVVKESSLTTPSATVQGPARAGEGLPAPRPVVLVHQHMVERLSPALQQHQQGWQSPPVYDNDVTMTEYPVYLHLAAQPGVEVINEGTARHSTCLR